MIHIPENASRYREIRQDTGSDEAATQYLRDQVNSCVAEIENMLRLKGSPNVVSIEDFRVEEEQNGTIGWTIYIRMELMEDLQTHFTYTGINEAEVIRLGRDIASALVYCERMGVIHRDIKPQNILCSEQGDYKLTDFGVAKYLDGATSAFTRTGTDLYMAPEIYNGRNADYRSDMYSLALVMYRMLNRNKFPFVSPDKQLTTNSDRETALRRRMTGEKIQPPADASPELSGILLRALEYNPENRYPHAADFLTEYGSAWTIRRTR